MSDSGPAPGEHDSDPPPTPSFWGELRRRKVVRVAIVYAAVAWAVVQAADVFVPALRLPESIITAVAFLALLGVPVALVLAWALEMTPEGVRRTKHAATAPEAALAQVTSTSWLGGRTLAVAGVFAVLGLGAGWLIAPGGVSSADDASIAVLPLTSLSTDAENAFFADGVHEEILTRLARIKDLRVISRNSVQEYRGGVNLQRVAEELDVAHVLEGSVRRSQDGRVRVTAQLIQVRPEERHLWADNFDGDLSDIFAIQADIAERIARALEAELSDAERARIEARPTTDLEAYDRYLEGQTTLAGFDAAGDGMERAQALFREAVRRDPDFGEAWAGLSRALSTAVHFDGLTGSDSPPGQEALRALERARADAPGTSATHVAEGYYHYYVEGAYEPGLRAFDAAVAVEPGNAQAHLARALILRRLGRSDETRTALQRAYDLNPRDASVAYNLGLEAMLFRRFDVARTWFDRAVALDPGNVFFRLGRSYDSVVMGDTSAAADAAREFEPGTLTELVLRVWPDYLRGTPPEGFLDSIRAIIGDDPIQVSEMAYGPFLPMVSGVGGAGEHARWIVDEAGPEFRRVAVLPLHLATAELVEALAYQELVRGEEAVARLERVEELLARIDRMDEPPIRAVLGAALVRAGRMDEGFAHLEAAYELPSMAPPVLLTMDPVLAPWRDDPRLQALIAEIEATSSGG